MSSRILTVVLTLVILVHSLFKECRESKNAESVRHVRAELLQSSKGMMDFLPRVEATLGWN
jgi:hypothetical protein